MKKPLLIINAGPTFEEISAEHGEFHKWVSDRLGTDNFIVADVEKGEKLPGFSEVSGAVMTGSHCMVTEKLPWSEYAAEWIKDAVGEGLPFFGICYGHQLLAYALGGRAGYHPEGMEIGTVEISLAPEASADDVFKDMPKYFSAHVIHSQSVLSLPEGAVRLASNSHDPNHAFRVKNAWGVQFHPEFSAEAMRGYLARYPDRGGECSSDTEDAESLLRKFTEFCKRG